jgi:hypothetical protein
MRAPVILAVLLLLTACSDKSRCRDVCRREAACSDLREDTPRFDPSECIEACNDLERDVTGRDIVHRHADCVEKAADCTAVFRCP